MTQRVLSALLLVSALLVGATPAFANKDAVQFGSNIVVPEGQTIHDAVCFFCSVNAQGTIDHDVVVFFGNVHVAHESRHDIVDFFGTVRADDDASIGHDVVNFFGSVRLGENATVGNDLVVMFGNLHAADSANIGGNRVFQPLWVFMTPLIVLGLIVTLIVHEVRSRRRRNYFAAYGYPQMPPQPPSPPAPPMQ
jgi:hypothetical protein